MLAEHNPAAAAGRDKGRKRRLCLHRDLSWSGGPSKLLDTIRIHRGPGTAVPQVAAAGAEGMRTLYPDVTGIECVGVSPLHSVPLKGLQPELGHGGVAIVGVEYVDVLGTEPSALEHHPGHAVCFRL